MQSRATGMARNSAKVCSNLTLSASADMTRVGHRMAPRSWMLRFGSSAHMRSCFLRTTAKCSGPSGETRS